MINPSEIKLKAEKKYTSFLKSILRKESFFPLEITGNKRASKDLSEFRKEIALLRQFSKQKKGFGYSLKFEERKTKNWATQSFVSKIEFENQEDYLKFLRKQNEFEVFKTDYQEILTQFPELQIWIEKAPQKVIKNARNWEGLLKVCTYFQENPKPQCYIRELAIKVHTKFVENNKSIIQELLDILISGFVNLSETNFEKRFNLKYSQPLIRFKILDNSISNKYFSGINDISIPINQFESLDFRIKKVIIVENKTNLYTTLTLTSQQNTIAIFGKGFSVANLKKVEWLKNIEIIYWGDIDAQGFEILSQMRGYFAQTKSILMDKTTFDNFFENDNGTLSKVSVKLNLNQDENELYRKLKKENWRLEQEKIPLEYVKNAFLNYLKE